MNECCKRYIGRGLRVEFMDPCLYDIECGSSIHFGRRDMRFCPECGSRLKEPVVCQDCRFFLNVVGPPPTCIHPSNAAGSGDRVVFMASPRVINKNNECDRYEQK
jgi:hypothetical protein